MPELIHPWIFINRAAYQYYQNTWNWKSYMQFLEWSDPVGSRSEYWIRNVNSLPPHTRDILRSVAFQKPWHYFIFLFYKMFSSIDLASERFLKILVSIHFDFVRVWMQIVFFVEFKIVFSEMKSCHKTLILSSSIFALFQDFYHGRILMQCSSPFLLICCHQKWKLVKRKWIFYKESSCLIAICFTENHFLILNRSNQYYIQTWLFSWVWFVVNNIFLWFIVNLITDQIKRCILDKNGRPVRIFLAPFPQSNMKELNLGFWCRAWSRPELR